jgi:hypothetical protein
MLKEDGKYFNCVMSLPIVLRYLISELSGTGNHVVWEEVLGDEKL